VGNSPEKIALEQRTGLITAIGSVMVLIAGYIISWSLGDGTWGDEDMWPAIFLSIGLLIVFISLFLALGPHEQGLTRYKWTVRILFIGVFFFVLGAVLGELFNYNSQIQPDYFISI